MSKKRKWRDWAIDYIKRTKRCPGDQPSFGSPSAMMTETEFNLTIESAGTHVYNDCHFVDEIMGTVLPDMQVVKTDKAVEISDSDRDKQKTTLAMSEEQRTVDQLKKDLETYVGMIRLKDTGVLYVPEPLLKIEAFIKRFFDIS